MACLGDGHDGIWNIIGHISIPEHRREILDWYHLVENLHKVGGSLKRLHQAETLLWQGKVDETLALFEPLQKKVCPSLLQLRPQASVSDRQL